MGDFKRVMTAIVNFVNVELSAVYFDIRKDALYCDPAFATAKAWDAETSVYGNRRRAVRTVMAAVMERLLCWLAPVMPFTTDEAFYGKRLEVQLVAYLRPEHKFPSLDAMVEQMHRDAAQAKEILARSA